MIPSLLQIPSAVSDSKLHSVLPNNGKGDFTFDRSTGATRINKDGLIEEVGYFSSELVQNGNFSELGSELVTNGDFATDSDWNKGTGWSINDGKAVSVGGGDFASFNQDISAVTGKTYKITFTISDFESGQLFVNLQGSSTTYTSSGTYTLYLAASGSRLYFVSGGSGNNFVGKIDNVSVKQVDPNDRWTLDTGWSFGTDKVIFDGGSDAAVQQSNVVQPSTLYRVLFTVTDRTTGSLQLRLGNTGVVDANIDSNSNFSFDLTTDSSGTSVYFRGTGGFNGAISNISVKEIQGDRPRLSYDITNGVVEDKPHLLLEPSSTNLFPFSEDYTQSNWIKSNVTITQNAGISPENINNASKMIVSSNASFAYIHDALSGSSSKYSISAFVKADGRNIVWLYINSSSSNGTIYYDLSDATLQADAGSLGTPTGTITAFPNNWYKITYTSPTAFILGSGSGIGVSDAKGSTAATIDGTNGVLIYGLQIEAQSYATSYIPTAGTTITRAAETCNNSKPSVNSTEGVLYAEIQALANDGTNRIIALSDGTGSNLVRFYFSNSSNRIVAQIKNGGSTQATFDIAGITVQDFNKVAVKYKANDFAIWINGTQRDTDTSGSTPTGLNLLAFDDGAGSSDFYGKVKGLAVYNEALSESQLFQLTGVTASSIYSNFVTRTASFTVEALNEVKKVIDNL